jgi:hypothetical protein
MQQAGRAAEPSGHAEPLWPTPEDDARTYLLVWLGIDESRRVSMEAFGLDLDQERTRRQRAE